MRSVKVLLLLSAVMLASSAKLPSDSFATFSRAATLYDLPIPNTPVEDVFKKLTTVPHLDERSSRITDLQPPSETFKDAGLGHGGNGTAPRREEELLQSSECSLKYSTVTTTRLYTNTMYKTSIVRVSTSINQYRSITKTVYSTQVITKLVEDLISKHHKFGEYETITLTTTSTRVLPASELILMHTTTTTVSEYTDVTSTLVDTVILQTTDYVTTTVVSRSATTISVHFYETLFRNADVPVETYTNTATAFVTVTETADTPIDFSTSVLIISSSYTTDHLLPQYTSTMPVYLTVTAKSSYLQTVTATATTINFITHTQSVTYTQTDYYTTVLHTTRIFPVIESITKTVTETTTVEQHVVHTSTHYTDVFTPLTNTVTVTEDVVMTKVMNFPGVIRTKTVTSTSDITETVTAAPRTVQTTITHHKPCSRR